MCSPSSPTPTTFALLEENVALNGYDNATLIRAAVSDVSGQVCLYCSSSNLGDHRLYDPGDAGRSCVDLPAVSLLAVDRVGEGAAREHQAHGAAPRRR